MTASDHPDRNARLSTFGNGTWKHTEFLDDETRALLSLRQSHPEWLDLRFTRSVEESMALNRIKAGAVAQHFRSEAGCR